ncbi:hypothetical protein KK083_14570 [Fulvivirgaceae bacterium PWU4]|uniref:Uncharacterized protein n=1 Tax=Chryseosolibacter histidini TaxID=2782349 RepID=A0AAP2DPU5_9BACT|nr:hypothetical protein [Chryseosolibacter histidini]MBT1698114.1 hypothetical protein [Chryseosolibacter histidini]
MSDFNKQVGKIISKARERQLTENWKKTSIVTQSSFVGADILLKLLRKPGAVGLRIQYGIDDDGNMHPVFFACDATGKIIRTVAEKVISTFDPDDSDGADASLPCPPYCP